jgi:hypothetical protein
MKTLLVTLICIVGMAAVLSLAGCSQATAADSSVTPEGRKCTVQLRGDALGPVGNVLTPPRRGNSQGGYTTISCAYKSTRDQWVIVDCAHKEVWIPSSVILLIEFE